METRLLGRAEKLMNPFIKALNRHPTLSGSVVTHNSAERLPVPGVVVSVSGGEQRLDHGGDSWDFDVIIKASRTIKDAHLLDDDAAAIEQTTSTAMGADPNISLMIAEEGSDMSWDVEGKTRTFTMTTPIFVVFS